MRTAAERLTEWRSEMTVTGGRVGLAEEVLWLCARLDEAEQRAWDALAALPSLPGPPIVVVAVDAPGAETALAESEPVTMAADVTCNCVQALVDEQAEDEGLWFEAETAAEAYLQQELRCLHRVIEAHRTDRAHG